MAQSTVDTIIQMGGVVITVIAGFITLFLNERGKRSEEEYKRKEERYVELLKALRGFYVESFDKDMRESFLSQLNLCWLYCPDDVIHKAYKFLLTVKTGEQMPDAEREKALGEFILVIRKDLLSRKSVRNTSLAPEDFKNLRAT